MTEAVILSARGLCRSFHSGGDTSQVLDHLDLEVHSGEIVAIIGRSGSGKSTLLNLIGQMDSATAGTLVVDGIDTGSWDDERRTAFRCARLGFVFQAYNLLPTLTVYENVALPLELNGIDDDQQVERLLGRLGLGALAKRYPDEISGGELQRTAIARALVHRPALIIADEPTGNLDQHTGQQVIDLFEQNVRAAGAALIMATHSLDMVGRADRVLELSAGRLREIAR